MQFRHLSNAERMDDRKDSINYRAGVSEPEMSKSVGKDGLVEGLELAFWF
jgi:hypothetical protein